MNTGWLRRFRAFFPFLTAVTALVILNGSSWWAYRIASEELKQSFQRSVLSFSEFLARQIEIAYRADLEKNLALIEKNVESEETLDSIDDLVPDFGDWLRRLPPRFLVELTPHESSDPLFHDLYLMARNGELLQTWAGEIVPSASADRPTGFWRIHPLLAGDRPFILQALQTNTNVMTDEEVELGGFFLTCYAPIDFNGVCQGLVGVRANILFAERLEKLRQGLILAVAVGSLLIVGLAWMFYRVFRQLDEVQNRMVHRE